MDKLGEAIHTLPKRDRLQSRVREAGALLEWASSCLVSGEGLDDLLRAIDEWRGVQGRVTDRKQGDR